MLGGRSSLSGAIVAIVLTFAGSAGAGEAPRLSCNAGSGAEWKAACSEVRLLIGELEGQLARMKDLRKAQKALMEWNKERAELGLQATTLRPELCLETEHELWCRLFPATFGVQEEGL